MTQRDIAEACDEIENAGRTQAIKYLKTPFVIFDDARIPQLAEVSRYRGNIAASLAGQLVDTFFATGELHDEIQSHRMRESFQDLHRPAQLFRIATDF